MTQDPGDGEPNKSDAIEGEQLAPKARRRLALTMLDVDSPQLKIVRRLLQIRKHEIRESDEVPHSEKPQPTPRVSKTMLEVDQPASDPSDLVDEKTEPKSASRPKVARTLMEADLPAIDQLHVDQPEVSGEKSEEETAAKPRVSKTLMEVDLSSIDQLEVDRPEVSGEKPDEETAPKPRVSKTLMEVDLSSIDQLEVDRPEVSGEKSDEETAPKPRVSKTLMEADLPAIDQLQVERAEEIVTKLEKETAPRPRVGRTLGEADVRFIERLQAAQAEETGEESKEEAPALPRDERTLNEADVRFLEQLQADQSEDGGERSEEETAARPRVGRTLGEADVRFIERLQAAQAEETSEEPEEDAPAQPRVARTLMEEDLPSVEQLHVDQTEVLDSRHREPVSMPPMPPMPPMPKMPKSIDRTQHFVAKTLLDCEVLAGALQKFQVRKVEVAAEEAKIRASLPGVEFHPVDSKKLAQRCAWKWEDESNDRFRYCQTCRSQVYNFEGLELAQAEALILIRENKRSATLYKRPDGKFMTQDCPVQVRKKRTILFLSIVGVTLVCVSVATLILMPPRLPAHKPTYVNPAGAEIKTTKSTVSSKSTKPGQAGGQPVIRHTGTRKRPTFTPKDTNQYWE